MSSKLCTIDATRTMFVTNIYTTDILEQTRSHEIKNDLNYNERNSFIPDYFILAR